ncbi:hypothetical protein YC2023_041988 [Brassica napus]
MAVKQYGGQMISPLTAQPLLSSEARVGLLVSQQKANYFPVSSMDKKTCFSKIKEVSERSELILDRCEYDQPPITDYSLHDLCFHWTSLCRISIMQNQYHCSYGNCQATFHPTCARSVAFHMTGGGKLRHKAYCTA